MKSLFFITWVFVLTGSLPAQEVPVWALRLPDLPNMPGFYQGLGSAQPSDDVDAGWQKASGQARGQILQQIRVVVINKVAASIEEKSAAEHAALNETFSSTTEQLAAGTLENIVVERWFDDKHGVLYAYARVSRAEVALKFEERLHTAAATVRILHEGALNAVNDDDVALALEQYVQAMKVATLTELYLNTPLKGVLRPGDADTPMLPVLQRELCALTNRLQIRLSGGNEQLAEKGRALPQPLAGRVLFMTKSGAVPARNIALTAAFLSPAAGTFAGSPRTNEQGEFRLVVNEIVAGQGSNSIRVGIGVPQLDVLSDKLPDAIRCMGLVAVDFTFRLKSRANATIAMHILEYNLDARRPKSIVQEEIQRRLLDSRYAIVDESLVQRSAGDEKFAAAMRSGNFKRLIASLSIVADIVVVGLVQTEKRANPTEGIYFAGGSAIVRVLDAKTGQVLASVAFDNEKEGGSSYDVAGLRLLQKLARKVGEELKIRMDSALN